MRTLLALGLVALTLLAFAATARAGTYPMQQCQIVASRAVSDRWGAYGNGGMFNQCGGNTGFGLWTGQLAANSTVGLTIGVPDTRPHVTIARVDSGLNVATERDQYSFLRWFGGGQLLFDQEMTGWSSAGVSRPAPAGTRDFTLDLYCSYQNSSTPCRFDNPSRAVTVSWLIFTLAENVNPSATATGGSLLADGPRSGTASLNVAASDEDSGVRTLAVKLGDTQVGRFSFDDACTWDSWNACPTSQARALDVDTTRLRDGAYPLRFEVADAAGNATMVESGRTITVANDAASAPRTTGPASGGASSGGASSSSSDRSADASARGEHNGSGVAAGGVLTAELVNRRQAMIVPYRKSAVRMSGRLTQQDGTPIAGAKLDVGSQTVIPGLPGPDGGQVVTDEDGRWGLVTAQGPSRQVTVSWRAFDRDRSYSEATRLSLLVRAGAKVAVRPRRVRNGGRVTVSGKLLGGPFPDGGVLITLQGKPRQGGRWRTFGITRSKPNGRFRYRYRFTRVTGATRTFLFRARVSRQDGYPYEAGVAGSARARVRG
jgi:hypothetical protein